MGFHRLSLRPTERQSSKLGNRTSYPYYVPHTYIYISLCTPQYSRMPLSYLPFRKITEHPYTTQSTLICVPRCAYLYMYAPSTPMYTYLPLPTPQALCTSASGYSGLGSPGLCCPQARSPSPLRDQTLHDERREMSAAVEHSHSKDPQVERFAGFP